MKNSLRLVLVAAIAFGTTTELAAQSDESILGKVKHFLTGPPPPKKKKKSTTHSPTPIANRAAEDIAATEEFATADRNSRDNAFSDACTDSRAVAHGDTGRVARDHTDAIGHSGRNANSFAESHTA